MACPPDRGGVHPPPARSGSTATCSMSVPKLPGGRRSSSASPHRTHPSTESGPRSQQTAARLRSARLGAGTSLVTRAQGPAGHASDHGQFLHFTLGFWPSQPYVLESIFKFRYLSRPKRRHYLQGDPLAIPSPNLTTRSSHRNRHTYSYRNVLTQAVCFKAGSKYWSILLNLV